MARYLAAFLLLPNLFTALAAPAVFAQADLGTEYVVVIDFANNSKYGDSVVSRLATDAVVVELNNTNRFSVATRQQVRDGMNALDLNLPLDLAGVMRLGEHLAANAVIVGEVRQLRITDKPRQAQVELVIRSLDASSGEPMNGAVALGRSTPRETFTGDDDILVTEAINNAAFIAVRKMMDYIIPEVTVLNAVGDDRVLLNKGAQDGISTGMEMIVSRRGEVIGKIRVVEVSNNDAMAQVVSANRGVKPEDRARAVFRMPTGPSAAFGEPATKISDGLIGSRRKSASGGDILKWVLGLGLLALLIGQHSSSGESVGSQVAAEAGVPPLVGTLNQGPGVKITLDPSRYDAQNLLEWHIWRNDISNGPVLKAEARQRFMNDDMSIRSFSYRTVDPNSPEELGDGDVENFPGIQPGVTYEYYASAIIRRIISLAGEGGPVYRYEETPHQFIGRATPIEKILRAGLSSPLFNASDVDLNSVDFNWLSVLGADQYIVEASTDPSFRRVDYRSGIVVASPSSEGDQVVLENQNLQQFFSNVSANTVIYWRVGCKNSLDQPGPVPDPFSKQRFVFSETSQFRVNDAPPPPPN